MKFIRVLACSSSSFSLLRHTPYFKYTTTYLSILPVTDIWVIFSLGPLEIMLLCMFLYLSCRTNELISLGYFYKNRLVREYAYVQLP